MSHTHPYYVIRVDTSFLSFIFLLFTYVIDSILYLNLSSFTFDVVRTHYFVRTEHSETLVLRTYRYYYVQWYYYVPYTVWRSLPPVIARAAAVCLVSGGWTGT